MERKFEGIRYVKLHFALEMLEDTELPFQKASMLRGGMGEMLMQSCCISNRECEKCSFESECIVRRIMYSKMEIQPPFMSSGDSVGYVIECDNYMTDFKKGDRLAFRILLIGKTIVYFSQILEAFYRLGLLGIGKENARFRVVEVLNSRKEPILFRDNIQMGRVKVETVGEYIRYRMRTIAPEAEKTVVEGTDPEMYNVGISFRSPLTIKHRGEMMTEFDTEAIMKSLQRRLYVLCCFEGIDAGPEFCCDSLPEIDVDSCRRVEVPRYSFHKNEKMILWGNEGEARFRNVSRNFLELLMAGELLHIGKNTSFGFGKYRLK